MGATAGWYPDPDGSGRLRYFDGNDWTEHRADSPSAGMSTGYGAWSPPWWKGAQLGRPAQGAGSLASPGRRLGARALDGLVLLPVVAVAVGIGVAVAVAHAGPVIRASQQQSQNAPLPASAFFWIYGSILASIVAVGLVQLLYETVATARYGRTVGKMWLHIRPLRTDGQPVGWTMAFVRVLIYWLFGLLGWIGFVNPLWCLWDQNQQCLHDKVASTIVVND